MRPARRGDAQRTARRVGKAFEKLIGERIDADSRYGGPVAWYTHAEPVMRWLPNGPMPVAQGGADFSGFLSSGLCFAVEVKTCKVGRYGRKQLHDRQVAHLDAVTGAGGVALLALEFRDETPTITRAPRQFVVPWHAVPWTTARSAVGVSLEDLARWPLPRVGLLPAFAAPCSLCCVVVPSHSPHECPGPIAPL